VLLLAGSCELLSMKSERSSVTHNAARFQCASKKNIYGKSDDV
jgi:hypothetical protein